MLGTRLLSASGTSAHEIFATDFSTPGSRMQRSSLVGATTTSRGILSFWFKLAGGAGQQQVLFSSQNGEIFVSREANNSLQFQVLSETTTFSFTLDTIDTFTSDIWRHFLISWDTNFSGTSKLGSIYINGILQNVSENASSSAFSTAWASVSDYAIAATYLGVGKFGGDLSEFYLNLGQYLDFSVESNIRKFYSADGEPANLGINGSIPTGSIPIVYLPNPYTSFNVNTGTGGNFTVVGTLLNSSTVP